MIATVSIIASIHRELHDARATGYKRIVHIRVTADALAGSVTSVPVTPERARVLGKLLMIRSPGEPLDGAVIADPADAEALLELLMHPLDWAELLADLDAIGYVSLGEPIRVMGIPVSQR